MTGTPRKPNGAASSTCIHLAVAVVFSLGVMSGVGCEIDPILNGSPCHPEEPNSVCGSNGSLFCWSPANRLTRLSETDAELGASTPDDPSLCLPSEAAYCGDSGGLSVVSEAQAAQYDALFAKVALKNQENASVGLASETCPQGAEFRVDQTSIENLDLPSLTVIPGTLNISNNVNLVEIALPELQEVGQGLSIISNPLLAKLDLTDLARISTDDAVSVKAAHFILTDNPSLSELKLIGDRFRAELGPAPERDTASLQRVEISRNDALSTCRLLSVVVEFVNSGFDGAICLRDNHREGSGQIPTDADCASVDWCPCSGTDPQVCEMSTTEFCQAIDATNKLGFGIGVCTR